MSLRRVLPPITAVAYVLFWIGWRVELYHVYSWFWVVLLGSVVCGALIGKWWALSLSLIPVVFSIGVPNDDAPAFVIVFALVTPGLALALLAGVLAAHAAPLRHGLRRPRPSGGRQL